MQLLRPILEQLTKKNLNHLGTIRKATTLCGISNEGQNTKTSCFNPKTKKTNHFMRSTTYNVQLGAPGEADRPQHPTPYTLHPTPYTLHPTPYTLHPTPYTLHPAPYTLHPTPHTPHPNSTPHTPHPTLKPHLLPITFSANLHELLQEEMLAAPIFFMSLLTFWSL